MDRRIPTPLSLRPPPLLALRACWFPFFMSQMERNVVDEAAGLTEQQKAVALARVRLHEQQMEMALQASIYPPSFRLEQSFPLGHQPIFACPRRWLRHSIRNQYRTWPTMPTSARPFVLIVVPPSVQ